MLCGIVLPMAEAETRGCRNNRRRYLTLLSGYHSAQSGSVAGRAQSQSQYLKYLRTSVFFKDEIGTCEAAITRIHCANLIQRSARSWRHQIRPYCKTLHNRNT